MRMFRCFALFAAWGAAPALAEDFALPVACEIGVECFVQNYPDVDPGSGVADPSCGGAAYDGHKGTDIRVRRMSEIAGAGVDVVAAADGIVLRARNGEADRLVRTEADRSRIASTECGNGLIIDHGDGWETQYCHMRNGSLVVAPGESVKQGQALGKMGASGFVEFPHVHIVVRKDGETMDPTTGRALSDGCLADRSGAQPLWTPDAQNAIETGFAPVILDIGFAGGPIDHDALVSAPRAEDLDASDTAHVAWAWVINLAAGDRVALRYFGPGGRLIAENITNPFDRSKAQYSLFAGKRGMPIPGVHRAQLQILRGGAAVAEKDATLVVDR